MVSASVAGAFLINGTGIFFEPGVLNDELPLRGEQAPVTGISRRKNAIHHVDTASHVLGQFCRHADAHGIARPVPREVRLGGLNHFETKRAWLADRKTADRVTIAVELNKALGAVAPEIREHGTLDYGK